MAVDQLVQVLCNNLVQLTPMLIPVMIGRRLDDGKVVGEWCLDAVMRCQSATGLFGDSERLD